MTDVASFHLRFPEFCEVADGRVQLFLDDAALLMADPAKWLTFYDVAQAYFTAHLLAVANMQESGDSNVLAPISSQEVDDVMIAQAVTATHPNTDELLSTSYGKRYWQYRRIITVGPIGV